MHQTTIAKIEAGERPVLVGEAVAFARIIGASLPDLVTDPAGPDLVDAIVARDKWVRRKNELDIMASHASTQLDTIQAERHAVSLELARASERVQELHDAGFQRATSQGK